MISESADKKFLKNLLGNSESFSGDDKKNEGSRDTVANVNNNMSDQTNNNTKEDSDKASVLMPKINLDKLGGDAKKKGKALKVGKKGKLAIKIVSVLLVLLLVFFGIIGFLAYRIYQKGIILESSVKELVDSGKSQDLSQMQSSLDNTKQSLASFKSSYNTILWLKYVPFAGSYVADGEHGINAAGYAIDAAQITIKAVTPYADIIGFNGGKKASSGQETAKDRLDFVVKTIPNLLPDMDNLIAKVKLVRAELDQIDPNRYPTTFRGMQLRDKIK